MTDTIAADVPQGHSSSRLMGVQRALLVAPIVVLAADFLFYGREIGISAALFLCLLAMAIAFANPVPVWHRTRAIALGVLLTAVLPMVESFGLLSLLSGLVGIAVCALVLAKRLPTDIVAGAWEIARLHITGPFLLWTDLELLRRLRAHRQETSAKRINWWALAIPLGIGGVFVALFVAANPIIEQWLSQLDPFEWIAEIDGTRPIFWMLTAGLTWSFLRVGRRWGRKTGHKSTGAVVAPAVPTETAMRDDPSSLSRLSFGPGSAFGSLALFNALFAVQTGLDVGYLWGGLSLPDGMTYADYAHRGAYPLMLTVLLAAAIVLVVMKPRGASERSPAVRGLVYLWIAQTIGLVLSSILRLDLYVSAYALTYLRVAAFIWMGLVALGLVLIVVRIATRRSNRWLVSANMIALATTIYACGFINFPGFVAAFNVRHAAPVTSDGGALHVAYLCELGPEIIPVVDRFLLGPEAGAGDFADNGNLGACRSRLVAELRNGRGNWRAWSLRDHRLNAYLTEQERSAPEMLDRPGRRADPELPLAGGEPVD